MPHTITVADLDHTARVRAANLFDAAAHLTVLYGWRPHHLCVEEPMCRPDGGPLCVLCSLTRADRAHVRLPAPRRIARTRPEAHRPRAVSPCPNPADCATYGHPGSPDQGSRCLCCGHHPTLPDSAVLACCQELAVGAIDTLTADAATMPERVTAVLQDLAVRIRLAVR